MTYVVKGTRRARRKKRVVIQAGRRGRADVALTAVHDLPLHTDRRLLAVHVDGNFEFRAEDVDIQVDVIPAPEVVGWIPEVARQRPSKNAIPMIQCHGGPSFPRGPLRVRNLQARV
jgi:hypothetical protein